MPARTSPSLLLGIFTGHILAFPTRSPPQVQQYARDLEWQLLQEQQAQQARLESAEAAGRRAGAAAAGGLEGADAGTKDVPDSNHAGEDLVTHQGRRGGSLPEESAAAEGASGAAKSAALAPQRRARGRPRGSGKRQLAEGARAAMDVADELATLREQLASAERHLAAYDEVGAGPLGGRDRSLEVPAG